MVGAANLLLEVGALGVEIQEDIGVSRAMGLFVRVLTLLAYTCRPHGW